LAPAALLLLFGAAAMAAAAAPAASARSSESSKSARFRINGVDLEMPVPAGYCAPTGRLVDVAQLTASMDKDNVTHLTFYTCPTVSETDYILVKTPNQALLVDMDREQVANAVGAAMETPAIRDQLDYDAMRKRAAEGASEALHTKVEDSGEIRPLGHDSACGYVGGTMEVSAQAIRYRISLGACISAVGRRVVTVFVYGPDRGDAGVQALLGRARQLMETIRVAPTR
jgi:hypothetical protein